MESASFMHYLLIFACVISALGVLYFRNPVHASLSFLLSLLSLGSLYVRLSAPFIGIMQVMIYAGAILVIFMFVILLFQNSHESTEGDPPSTSQTPFIVVAGLFALLFAYSLRDAYALPAASATLPEGFGSVTYLGKALYLEMGFPFEILSVLFLVAIVGTFYIVKKES